jgi:hypothetical protein
MFYKISRAATFIGLAAVLSSCSTTGMFHQPGEAYISEVNVTAPPSAPPDFNERIRTSVLADTQRFPQTGAAKRVSIMVTGYHMKNPGLSLLVGDNNRVTGALTVFDAATGLPSGSASFAATNGDFPQGVAGLVLAAAQDAGAQENVLAAQASHAALEQFYGTRLLQSYMDGRQVISPGATPIAAAPSAPVNPTIRYVPLLPANHKQSAAAS